jgi:hypothetical protein
MTTNVDRYRAPHANRGTPPKHKSKHHELLAKLYKSEQRFRAGEFYYHNFQMVEEQGIDPKYMHSYARMMRKPDEDQ